MSDDGPEFLLGSDSDDPFISRWLSASDGCYKTQDPMVPLDAMRPLSSSSRDYSRIAPAGVTRLGSPMPGTEEAAAVAASDFQGDSLLSTTSSKMIVVARNSVEVRRSGIRERLVVAPWMSENFRALRSEHAYLTTQLIDPGSGSTVVWLLDYEPHYPAPLSLLCACYIVACLACCGLAFLALSLPTSAVDDQHLWRNWVDFGVRCPLLMDVMIVPPFALLHSLSGRSRFWLFVLGAFLFNHIAWVSLALVSHTNGLYPVPFSGLLMLLISWCALVPMAASCRGPAGLYCRFLPTLVLCVNALSMGGTVLIPLLSGGGGQGACVIVFCLLRGLLRVAASTATRFFFDYRATPYAVVCMAPLHFASAYLVLILPWVWSLPLVLYDILEGWGWFILFVPHCWSRTQAGTWIWGLQGDVLSVCSLLEGLGATAATFVLCVLVEADHLGFPFSVSFWDHGDAGQRALLAKLCANMLVCGLSATVLEVYLRMPVVSMLVSVVKCIPCIVLCSTAAGFAAGLAACWPHHGLDIILSLLSSDDAVLF